MRRAPGFGWGIIASLLVVWSSVPGCLSPEEYKAEADDQVYGVLGQARVVANQAPDDEFDIEDRSGTLRPTLLLPRPDDREPGPLERLARDGAEVEIALGTSLAIAGRNSREFQDQRERLYQTALTFTSSLHDFESQFFGMIGATGASRGDGESDSTLSLAENSSFGFTRLLESGGAIALAIGQNATRFFSNPADTVATAFINLTVDLPLLRGAGRDVAYEGVTQAERNVIYAVRDYERFKQEFAVDVVSEYLRLLQNLNQVQNERANYDRREQTAVENRALGEAGRIARTDVERANQALLAAENRVIVAEENFENALDRFKLTLGLPTDSRLVVDAEDLVRLTDAGIELEGYEERVCLGIALGSRLDFANSEARVFDARRRTVVAANALEAGLDFSLSADFGTSDFANRSFKLDPIGDADYTAGLDLDLPFDRLDERNAYRRSLIDVDVSQRAAEAFEDQVKLQVRRNLRALRQAEESHRIQLAALEVARTNVDAAELLKAAGEGTTLDLLDAQNDLLAAENSVTAALIDYTIARLQLLRDLGVLTVTAQGIDHETTRRLLRLEE